MKEAEGVVTPRTRLRDAFKRVGIFLLATLVFTTSFGVAHVVMAQVYLYSNLDPTPIFRQIINSLAGLLILTCVGATIAYLFRSSAWAQRQNLFLPLLRAMEQIARGDFSVRVESPINRNAHEPFQQLFQGINDMAEQLKQMEEMRQEFISNVSHEIQSPLTSIRGFARVLQSEQLSTAERAHYLSIIETESMRLSKLSDNLLSLAALDAQTIQLDCRSFRLDRQLRSLILACEPQWSSKQIDMTLAADEIIFSGDENLLSQVWGNLLHNAIKFTPKGGAISVTLQQCDAGIEFRISDSGIGIAPEDQERLFERFYKADKARNRTLSGNGLGLAIAKKVVEMHGGTIRVQSTLGAGATFTVQLPQMQ